jgi:hypothetical protein
LKLVSTSAGQIVIDGQSSGTARSLTSIATSSVINGTYTTIPGLSPTSTINSSSSCGQITIPGLNIANGKYVLFTFSGNVDVSQFEVTPACFLTTQLTAPAVGTGSNITNNGFTANWTDVSNAIGYTVTVYDASDNLVQTVSGLASNATSTIVSGLNANTTYTYKVTAIGDGDVYTNSNPSTASAGIRTLNSAKDITAFTVAGVNGTIGTNTITAAVPLGTNITALTPSVTVSSYASYSPSGSQNFSGNVTYTVTAEDGSQKTYTVSISVVPPVVYDVSGTAVICSGATNITLSGSQLEATYELFLNGVATGNTKAGTGSSLTWSVSAAGTYTVQVLAGIGYDATDMNGSAVVSVLDTWTGAVNNLWDVAGNWSCGVIPDGTTSVTIPSGGSPVLDVDYVVSSTGSLTLSGGATLSISPNKTLTINAGGVVDFGNNLVTILSDITGTGAIGQISGTLNNATNVTVERYIPNDGSRAWRLLSVPTQGGQTINASWQEGQANQSNTTPGYGTIITADSTLAGWQSQGFDTVQAVGSIQTFDPNSSTWTPLTNTNATPVATTSGYFLYVRGDRSIKPSFLTTGQDATTLRTNGTIYQGPVSIGVSPGQFGLIGNIYPAAVDFTQLSPYSLDDVFYVWDPKLYLGKVLGNYQTFSGTNNYQPLYLIKQGSYAEGETNTIIETGQAFFVHNGTGNMGSVQFNESSKILPGNTSLNVFRPASISGQLNTNLYSVAAGDLSDATVTVFDSRYSDTVDGHDALKFYNGGENMGMLRYGRVLSVEGRQPISVSDTIYYDMSNLQKQSYKLEFIPTGLTGTAYLVDNYLHTTTPVSLSNTDSVTFTVTSGAGSSASNRFMLVLSNDISPVPVVFSSITAKAANANANIVNWSVAAESGIVKYTVERSGDGSSFTAIGSVAADDAGSYAYTDAAVLQGANYYRVVAIGTTGVETYSAIVKVDASGSNAPQITIYPNPVTGGTVNIEMVNEPAGAYGVQLLNAIGQLVYRAQITIAGGASTQSISLPDALAAGFYRLDIITPNGERVTNKIVIK